MSSQIIAPAGNYLGHQIRMEGEGRFSGSAFKILFTPCHELDFCAFQRKNFSTFNFILAGEGSKGQRRVDARQARSSAWCALSFGERPQNSESRAVFHQLPPALIFQQRMLSSAKGITKRMPACSSYKSFKRRSASTHVCISGVLMTRIRMIGTMSSARLLEI